MTEWKLNGNKLTKTITGISFSDVINKLNDVATEANAMSHHPDFTVFDYKNIRFELSSHSEGKVTQKDYDLALKIDEIFN
jgi:4a-hydroxytetrahydrobiopterin dehydratase